MRTRFAIVLAAVSCPAYAQTVVVPNANATTEATGTFLGPLSNAARTYQLLIRSDQLTAQVGQLLTGLTWRSRTTVTTAWPPATATYADFDVFLSGSVDPAARSLTFANNVVGPQTQVRDGPLTIDPGAFPVTGSPHDFGVAIGFTPYLYTGGNLLVELRHGTSDTTSLSVEAILTSGTGYGTQFSRPAWTGSTTGTAGTAGNFSVTQFTTQAVPEPGSLVLLAPLVAAVFARRRRDARLAS